MDTSSAAFMSYARFDDEHNGGQLTKFRKLYYITCPILDDSPASSGDRLVKLIGERNYFDLRALRGRPPGK
ncbi:hypothetical protein [Massilia sp. TWR1-2-2]|uniref:hypothetical protein n=1 Tax=Massilia sp. TWR1-2-2 TaxID=2804584 RepID=UPI003CF67E95